MYACVPLVTGGCVVPDCELEVQQMVLSPDESKFATAYEKGCGALSSLNTRVAIHPVGDEPSDAELAFATEGRYGVRLNWKDERTVSVHFSCADIDRDCRDQRIAQPQLVRKEVAGIAVEYSYSSELQARLENAG
jgi:hypothetical protein